MKPVRGKPSPHRPGRVTVIVLALLLVIAGCGTVPTESSPQPISSYSRPTPVATVPEPEPNMDPQSLVAAMLRATADPDSGHAAARKFLTREAAQTWDDKGDTIILDDLEILVDQRTDSQVRMRITGDNTGTLRADGQLLPATGRVTTSVTLIRTRSGWRVDGALPAGVMLDRDAFETYYRPVMLYFTDRTGTRLVPDPRWLYGTHIDATGLVTRLIGGPAADLEGAVSTAFPPEASLRGPVADGGGTVRVDLSGIGEAGPDERTELAAQLIWTLNNASVRGRYVINADGAPLVADRAAGWRTSDVSSFDPAPPAETEAGLNVIRDGRLMRLSGEVLVPTGGELGRSEDVLSAAISADGREVAAVIDSPEGHRLVAGRYGEDPVEIVAGETISRPSLDRQGSTLWAIVDGRPTEWIRDPGGALQAVEVDAGQVADVVDGDITELQVAPDGVRAALIVDGQVVLAVVTSNERGQPALAGTRVAAYNVGDQVVSLSWASSTVLLLARRTPDSPVVQLSISGTPAVGLVSGNLTPPVSAVSATSATVYVADRRGVLRLGTSNGQPDQHWTEVPGAMTPGAVPVVP